MLTLCCVACLWCAAGEKAQKKLQTEAQTMPAMQMAFGSIFPGQPRAEPLLERRALAASNMPVAMATPLPMAGYGSWPLAAQPRMLSATHAPVLACAVRAP